MRWTVSFWRSIWASSTVFAVGATWRAGAVRLPREREKNCSAAEILRRALNRSDDAPTDQQNLSPSAVRQLTAEAISVFGLILAMRPATTLAHQLGEHVCLRALAEPL